MSTLKTKNIQHPSATEPAIVLNPNGTFTADIEDLSAESLHGGTFSLRNKIINGSFDIWQRGTNFSGNLYTADRWKTWESGDAVATTRVFGPQGTTYGISFDRACTFQQPIELPLVGKAGEFYNGSTWVLSWYSTSSNVSDFIVEVSFRDYPYDGTNTVMNTVGSISVAETVGSWTRFKVEVTIDQDPVGTNECLCVFVSPQTALSLSGIQFEKGGLTALEVRPKGFELSLCQRYFIRLNYPDSSYAALGSLQSSASPRGAVIHYPVSMRKPAQAADVTFSGVGTTPGNLTFLQPNTANPTTVGSIVGLGNSTESLHVYGNGFTSIGSIGQTSVLYAYAGSWIEITAEF